MRRHSYGENVNLSILDRFGQFLSSKTLRKEIGLKANQQTLLDLGCGYEATLTRPIWDSFTKVYLVDVNVNDALEQARNVEIIQGLLPGVLNFAFPEAINVVVANNILEHLEEPVVVLKRLKELVIKDSIILINVPSWRGKYFLELAAFRLNLAPRHEMEDHKYYFDKRSLWQLVRNAGFSPSQIKVRYKKFGLNVSCVIRFSDGC
jgi:trans-aconitate methyltransferase